ncbi:hypothetical protein EYF80_055284 [Liparis tanakae]|uniref:Uncharacterized protein n=1 Tax=Liparis tanakae TaxID=230148 RepID=A0A4Z2F1L4_9TELE|nr:hypothetical protein EYF80_055284 [Liparis tanakae]
MEPREDDWEDDGERERERERDHWATCSELDQRHHHGQAEPPHQDVEDSGHVAERQGAGLLLVHREQPERRVSGTKAWDKTTGPQDYRTTGPQDYRTPPGGSHSHSSHWLEPARRLQRGGSECILM